MGTHVSAMDDELRWNCSVCTCRGQQNRSIAVLIYLTLAHLHPISDERDNIQAWFQTSGHTSPKTGANLPAATLIPNESLKQLIQDTMQREGHTNIEEWRASPRFS